MSAKYIVRFDDASVFWKWDKWKPYLELMDKFYIKPIIAVIPSNSDPKMTGSPVDPDFWFTIRALQQKGYHIAMHGYRHLYTTRDSGIIGINNHSEFAGINREVQMKMLHQGYEILKNEKLNIEIFVAPSHSFDKNTIEALKQVTGIRYISDGFYRHPVRYYDINWIPQQLWDTRSKPSGTWTICIHPETDSTDFSRLENFLRKHQESFINPLECDFPVITTTDKLFNFFYRYKILYSEKIKSIIHKIF